MLYDAAKGETTVVQSSLVGDRLIHGFSTRFNKYQVSQEQSNLQNLYEVGMVLKINPEKVIFPDQKHTDTIKIVTGSGEDLGSTDAVITNVPGIALGIKVADCVPVLIYSRERHVFALVHAGWRGTAKNITSKVVDKMVDSFNIKPYELKAVVGPSIGHCCFEITEDTAEALSRSFDGQYGDDTIVSKVPNGKYKADLKKINAVQLSGKGVRDIDISEECTCCLCDGKYFSYRGNQQTSMRNFAVAQLVEG